MEDRNHDKEDYLNCTIRVGLGKLKRMSPRCWKLLATALEDWSVAGDAAIARSPTKVTLDTPDGSRFPSEVVKFVNDPT
jgi:hypothetical protein